MPNSFVIFYFILATEIIVQYKYFAAFQVFTIRMCNLLTGIHVLTDLQFSFFGAWKQFDLISCFFDIHYSQVRYIWFPHKILGVFPVWFLIYIFRAEYG